MGKRGRQIFCDGAEQIVSDSVTVNVIYTFEKVNVYEHHGDLFR